MAVVGPGSGHEIFPVSGTRSSGPGPSGFRPGARGGRGLIGNGSGLGNADGHDMELAEYFAAAIPQQLMEQGWTFGANGELVPPKPTAPQQATTQQGQDFDGTVDAHSNYATTSPDGSAGPVIDANSINDMHEQFGRNDMSFAEKFFTGLIDFLPGFDVGVTGGAAGGHQTNVSFNPVGGFADLALGPAFAGAGKLVDAVAGTDISGGMDSGLDQRLGTSIPLYQGDNPAESAPVRRFGSAQSTAAPAQGAPGVGVQNASIQASPNDIYALINSGQPLTTMALKNILNTGQPQQSQQSQQPPGSGIPWNYGAGFA